jgi:CheY-like chemotaxis protein
VDRPTLQQLVEESGRELAVQIATDILIIEDEALIAMDLENLLENLGHEVTGIARTRTDAVTLAKAKRPGLILADIQLADGSSGMDAVNELLTTFEVPVIFITAYPDASSPASGRSRRFWCPDQPRAVLRAKCRPTQKTGDRLTDKADRPRRGNATSVNASSSANHRSGVRLRPWRYHSAAASDR